MARGRGGGGMALSPVARCELKTKQFVFFILLRNSYSMIKMAVKRRFKRNAVFEREGKAHASR
jgi:hypothetical protein